MVSIREAGRGDEERVLDLLRDLLGAERVDQPGTVETFRQVIAGDSGTVLIAEDDGEDGAVLGLVSLSYPVAIRCRGRYASIEEFIVNARARGKGAGKGLLEAATRKAAEMGCYELQINRPTDQGYPVYLAAGFKDEGRALLMRPIPPSDPVLPAGSA